MSDQQKAAHVPVPQEVVTSRVFFFLTFLVLLILTGLLLRPFFSVILLSLVAVIVLKPLYGWFIKQRFTKGRPRLAATVTLLSFLFVLLVPISFFVYQFFVAFVDSLSIMISADLDALLQGMEEAISSSTGGTPPNFDRAAIQEAIVSATTALLGAATNLLGNLLSSLPKFLVDLVIFLVIVVSLLPGFDRLVRDIEQISPLGAEITSLYYKKGSAMINSMFKGIFLIAGLQGLIMGIFYALAGIDGWFFFAVLSMFLAMIPVVGISFLVIPMAIIFVLNDNVTSAVIVLIGFYGIANWVDVILRPRLVSKEAYMHFSLVLLGILGGLAFAGILGLFYGPVVILLLVTTIEIYGERYATQDGQVIGDLVRSQRERLSDESGVVLKSAEGQSDPTDTEAGE